MRKVVWDNPNKMHIETGHATFDRQTNVISDGNIMANTMRGWHIRAKNDTECFGGERPPGHLQDFDLSAFDWLSMPRHIREYIKKVAIDEPVWVYCFFHHNGRRLIVHGWVITSRDHKPLNKFVTGPTYKSVGIVYEAAKYVENSPLDWLDVFTDWMRDALNRSSCADIVVDHKTGEPNRTKLAELAAIEFGVEGDDMELLFEISHDVCTEYEEEYNV